MKHMMRLQNDPFLSIKNGSKTIEMRLYDDKRKKISIGDIIEFENQESFDKIEVEVLNLYHFNSFKELYNHFDPVSLGYNDGDIVSYLDMERYYSKEEQEKYGVLGIEVKLIK